MEPIRIATTMEVHTHWLDLVDGSSRQITLAIWSAVVHCGPRVLAVGADSDWATAITNAVAAQRASRSIFPSVYAGEEP